MLSLQDGSLGGGNPRRTSDDGNAVGSDSGPRMMTMRMAHGPLLGLLAAATAAAASAASEPALSYEELLNLEDVKVTTPQEVLDSLPYYLYDRSGCSTDSTCSICQCDYDPGEQLVRLPCMHILHGACARRWLGEYSKKCPVCKMEVC